MKKLISILLIISTLLFFVACSDDNKDESADSSSASNSQSEESDSDSSDRSVSDSGNDESVNSKDDSNSEVVDDDVNEEKNDEQSHSDDNSSNSNLSIDKTLTGLALSRLVNFEPPSRYYAKMEMLVNEEGQPMEMVMSDYFDGEKQRSEIFMMGSNRITIKPGDGFYYMYTEGESSGQKYPVNANEGNDTELPEFEGPDDSTDEDDEMFSNAKIVEFEGELCYYSEYPDEDDELGTVINKLWFSLDNSFLKQMIEEDPEGNQLSIVKVTEFDTKKHPEAFKIDDSIEFVE